MIDVQIVENDSHLTKYIIQLNKPYTFETSVMKIQNKYINLRNKNGGPPLPIYQKLIQLRSIAQTKILDSNKTLLVQALAWSALDLIEFFLLFSDDEITEAFCGEIGTPLTITHRQYGRCLTNQIFSEEFWASLKLQSELNSRQVLSSINPTLKTGMITDLGNFRISMQIPPRTPFSPAFNIRRIPKNPITTYELVKQLQVSENIAKTLIKAIQERKNIIIAGEPGSGKTTLANALLLHTDPSWRLIILEDAHEVNIPIELFPMNIRYSMPSIGKNNQLFNRGDEISRLLHRSPDYVFLGEIQNSQDTKITFEAFAAGIRGIATTHARNYDGLISRWTASHQLSEDLIGAIDYIVVTGRIFVKNKFILRTIELIRLENGEKIEVII